MKRSPVRPGDGAPSRAGTLLKSNAFRVGIILLSAAIIFGAGAFADRMRDDSDDGVDITLSLEDDLYEQARAAAESGETTAAVALLERVLAEDPGHERAAALLRRLTSAQANQSESGGTSTPDDGATSPGTQPGPDPGDETPDADTPQDDSAFLASVGDLRSLLPEVISGWRRGTPVVDSTDATVSFEPVNPGAISRVVYSVHDRGSAAEAEAFIENTSKMAYPVDGASVPAGVVDGYFGTDGTRLAMVAFARGRFAFEVMVVVPGGDPASAKESAIALAREFEATR
ncbi:MAG: hypothetical protein IBX63_07880 [Coriobacteriia bacterium]|nr:hypothetical protein [Coriobacteriia bacterium]